MDGEKGDGVGEKGGKHGAVHKTSILILPKKGKKACHGKITCTRNKGRIYAKSGVQEVCHPFPKPPKLEEV